MPNFTSGEITSIVREVVEQAIKPLHDEILILFGKVESLLAERKPQSARPTYATVAAARPDPAAFSIQMKAIEEDRLNQQCQKSLLIHNLPEEENDAATEKADNSKLADIVVSAQLKRTNLKKVFRLGPRNQEKPRPLKVEMDSVQSSRTVVRQFPKFRASRPELENCKARLDYSPAVLQIYRGLWRTALERNDKDGVMKWIVTDDLKLVQLKGELQKFERRGGKVNQQREVGTSNAHF